MKTTPYDSEKTRRFRKAIARFERELAPNPAGAPERPSSVANRRRNGRSTRNTPGWYDRYKKSGKSKTPRCLRREHHASTQALKARRG